MFLAVHAGFLVRLVTLAGPTYANLLAMAAAPGRVSLDWLHGRL